MRDYDSHAQQLTDAGGRLVVLTHDSEQVLRTVIEAQGFGATFVHVEPETWSGWGLQKKRRAELPYPTTLIVAPDGTLIFREIHTNHLERAAVSEVVERVAAWSQQHPAAPTAEPEQPEEPNEPDWDNAVAVSAFLAPGQLIIQLQVGPGFHVYGSNETISRPLAVAVDQLPELEVPIPTGDEKVLSPAMGSAWVLEGTVQLEATLPAGAPDSLSGELDYQVCTDTTCTAPTSASWTAALEDDR